MSKLRTCNFWEITIYNIGIMDTSQLSQANNSAETNAYVILSNSSKGKVYKHLTSLGSLTPTIVYAVDRTN